MCAGDGSGSGSWPHSRSGFRRRSSTPLSRNREHLQVEFRPATHRGVLPGALCAPRRSARQPAHRRYRPPDTRLPGRGPLPPPHSGVNPKGTRSAALQAGLRSSLASPPASAGAERRQSEKRDGRHRSHVPEEPGPDTSASMSQVACGGDPRILRSSIPRRLSRDSC
jgi:hypothetical protein